MTEETPPPEGEAPPPPANVEKLADHRPRRTSRLKAVALDGPVKARLQRASMITGPNCPYEPIGFDGTQYWVLGCTRTPIACAPRDLGVAMLQAICGNSPYLETRYPRMRNGKPVNGFVADKARQDLINACHEMGFWQSTQLRNVGAWLGEDGDLILHRGDHLFIRGQMRPLGRVGECVYVPGPPMPPLPKPENCRDAPGEILDRLETFPFVRGTFDAMLQFGQICVCIVGGALAFRPHEFLCGEIETGKSTLQLMISHLLSTSGLVSITNATAAGIWQALRGRSVAVAYDEFESERDNKRNELVLALARQASTGGMLRRGTAGHAAQEFPLVSPFLLSAVLPPPLNTADASRFAVLDLRRSKFPRAPFSVDRLEQLGAALTSILADRWQLFRGQVLPEVRRIMGEAGYPGRLFDLYGTLIGLVAVAQHDKIEDMHLTERVNSHQMQTLLHDAREEQTPEWRRCLNYLLSCRIERNRSTSEQFGELIEAAARPYITATDARLQRALFGDDEQIPHDSDGAARAAQSRLLAYGLRVARIADENAGQSVVLQVAHDNQQLAELFEPTRWRTSPESATGGGWTRALRRAPGAAASKHPVRFRGGVRSRAVNVPIVVVLQPGTSPSPTALPEHDGDGDAAIGMLH